MICNGIGLEKENKIEIITVHNVDWLTKEKVTTSLKILFNTFRATP